MDGDKMFPGGWNNNFPDLTPDGKKKAKAFTRTQKPPKYYFIDFGLSRQYDTSETDPLEEPIMGGDRTVPEFKTDKELCNPFHTDIYYIGNMIREYIIEVSAIMLGLGTLTQLWRALGNRDRVQGSFWNGFPQTADC